MDRFFLGFVRFDFLGFCFLGFVGSILQALLRLFSFVFIVNFRFIDSLLIYILLVEKWDLLVFGFL